LPEIQRAQNLESGKTINVFENAGRRKTNLFFAISFGGNPDYNDATVRLAAEAGHSAMLLSRGVVQGGTVHRDGRLPMVDRVMPRDIKVADLLLDLQTRFNASGH